MSLVSAVLRTSYDFEDSARALESQGASTGTMLPNTAAVSGQDAISPAVHAELEDYAEYLLKQTRDLSTSTFVRIAHVRIESNSGQVLNPRNAPDAAVLAAPDLRSFSVPVMLPDSNHVL